MPLAAKTILVTGASRGLGLEFVRQILQASAAPEVLIAACRNPSSAYDLQNLAKAHPSVKVIKLDVEKDEDIISAAQETKNIVGERGLNLLINNAGIYDKTDGSELKTQSRENMQRHFDVNCSGPIIMAQKFLPLLEQAAAQNKSQPMSSNKAALINISSIMASQNVTYESGRGTSFHYKCSKSAVTMATILISRELRAAGILALSLHPGWVRTDMGTEKGDISPEESITGCLQVIGSQGEESTGKLVNYKGDVIPF
ncbi:LOW QUALITY PROTEIN: C-factor [Aplysia californica]|uniref:LOW QUALITY PROTEIN: C-factor n=1 Tax=Aplysia californica TaxID=6500 RepID=A0ABM0JYU4_APLCA|nr:LOW QUALITY PROTEIN: C-factor [Aplysia californica]